MDFRYLIIIFVCFATQNVFANSYEIIEEQNHGAHIFTQGLEIDKNDVYISSGLYRKSFIEVQNRQGKAIRKRTVPPFLFAEGLTLFKNELFLLTWKAEHALVLDPISLQQKRALRYRGEGWGLTHTKKHLVRSDGTHRLFFHSAENFDVEQQLDVSFNGQNLPYINELEFANGFIWANVWRKDTIYQIDPKTGQALNEWDLSKLVNSMNLKHPDSVLNGIAYDKKQKAFWITGKNWPKRFLINFIEN